MLAHDFAEMPSSNGSLAETLLRCRWCTRTPAKATANWGGCPIRELEETGTILLSDYNPEGVGHFKGRNCITCDRPIMGHALRRGSAAYWCFPNQNQFSDGIAGCVWDVAGMTVPEEPVTKDLQ